MGPIYLFVIYLSPCVMYCRCLFPNLQCFTSYFYSAWPLLVIFAGRPLLSLLESYKSYQKLVLFEVPVIPGGGF
jgi:hypothetical protein